MNIRIEFEGGAWDGRVLQSASSNPGEAAEARRLFELTENGTRLAQFEVPTPGGDPSPEEELANPHQYMVVQRTEAGGTLVIHCLAVRQGERETIEA